MRPPTFGSGRWHSTLAVLALLGSPGLVRAGFDDNGFLTDWLVYGPLSQAGGCCPALDTIALDYLTDGVEIFESTMLPKEGDEVIPDFGITAASTEFHPVLAGEIASWRATNTIDPAGDGTIVNAPPDTVDFNLIYSPPGTFDSTIQGCPAPAENAMAYAVVYLNNASGSAIDANLELHSDDSVQVKLGDCPLFQRSIGRGFGGAGMIADTTGVTIPAGSHRLLVKVFNGCGGFGFRLRFTDPDTSAPITNLTSALTDSLDPTEFSVAVPVPNGLGVSHTAAPDRLIGLDKASTVTITAVKTFPDLDDDLMVTVTETLIPGTEVVAGSAVPPATAQTATTISWTLRAGDLVTSGITFDFKFLRPGSGCLAGSATAGNANCGVSVSGTACSVAVIANALFLGDLIGGGDGTGNKPEDQCGIRLDIGTPLLCVDLAVDNRHTNDSPDPELLNPSPVEDNPFVDSVFFIVQGPMAINSEGAEFTFGDDDWNPQDGGQASSWNHILSNITHDIDKGVGNIVCGGRGPFATGVGVHASAGVTFNLEALRAEHGADKVVSLGSLVGIDGCAGNIRTYIIYSDELGPVEEPWFREFAAGQAEEYYAPIPSEAKYVTFATGAVGLNANGTGADGCDHGVWAEARIFPELPEARITTDVSDGVAPLTVNFSGAGSVAPTGKTISAYRWDFGDGATGTGATVSHTYASRGTYTAKLTVETPDFLTDDETKAITVRFPCGNVAPYVSADVGSPTTAGCARLSGDCLEVYGGGRDITARSDQFQLTYKEKTGNVTLDAQITRVLFDGRTAGKAGIMFRDGPGPNAAFGYMHVNAQIGSLRATFQSRTATDAVASAKTGPVLTTPDVFLRLERRDAELIGSASSDGLAYTEVGRVTLAAPPASMLAGFAVTSRDSANLGNAADATFCNISYSDESAVENCTNGVDDDGDSQIDCNDADCTGNPACPTSPGFHRGDADQNAQLQLTDAIQILGFLFLGANTKVPDCQDAADADDNGQLQLTDAIRILGFLFLGGPAPASPGPPGNPCGPDAGQELGCTTYVGC